MIEGMAGAHAMMAVVVDAKGEATTAVALVRMVLEEAWRRELGID